MTRLLLALLLVGAFASGAAADKVLTYFTVTLTDVQTVSFARSANSPTGWTITATGSVRASSGAGYTASVSANATAGQRTAVENFIATHVVGAMNTQEGL